MKIIEKYLLKSFSGPFIWCSIIFIFLYVIIDLFENLDEILRNSVHWNILCEYYLNLIPNIFIKIIPLAILLSIIYTLTKLNRQNEITTMRASGMSLLKLFKPFIIIGMLISTLTLVINLNIVPITNRNAKEIKTKYLENKERKKTKKIYNNVTIYGNYNKIIFSKKFDFEKKILYEVIILKQYKNKLIQRTTAEKAIWKNGKWELSGAITYYMRINGKIIGNPSFNSKNHITLEEKPEAFIHNYTEAKFMKYDELKKRIEKFKGASNKITRRLLIDLYNKISISFISIIMVLIAIPFALNLNYGGTFVSIALCIAIGFLYYTINAISLALGNAGILPPLTSAWLTNIIFGSIGITLLTIIKD